MSPKLPNLAILPLSNLILHENHDGTRTAPLIKKIEASNLFSNPPIVSPLHDRTGRYMVLDGANRTTSMRQMGYEHILAQVVEPDSLGFEIETWNHVAWDLDPDEWYEGIRSIAGLHLSQTDAETGFNEMIGRRAMAVIHEANGQVHTAHVSAANLIERNEYLNKIVDSYKDRAPFDRTNLREVATLKKLHPTLSGLVIMPRLRISHVMQLAGAGHMLPAGVTRFIVSPRALRVNYPLEMLANGKSLEEKNDALNELIKARMARKGIRYYAEETVLYDE